MTVLLVRQSKSVAAATTQGSRPGNDEDHPWNDEGNEIHQLPSAFTWTENQSCNTEQDEEYSETDGNFGLFDVKQLTDP